MTSYMLEFRRNYRTFHENLSRVTPDVQWLIATAFHRAIMRRRRGIEDLLELSYAYTDAKERMVK